MPHDLTRFLLCFGCQRGGTTWVERQLRVHPGFSLPPRKEIRYLDPLYFHDFDEVRGERIAEFCENHPELTTQVINGEPLPENTDFDWEMRYLLTDRPHYTDDWYRGLFSDCDNELVTADFSPDYSLLPEEGVAHLARLLPHARLLFILRDPVERTISGATYILRNHPDLSAPEVQNDVLEFTRTDLQRRFSDYQTILERFQSHFGSDRILIQFQDDIVKYPFQVLRNICNHTGTSFNPIWFNETLRQLVNRSPLLDVDAATWREVTEYNMPTLEWLARNYGDHALKWLDRAKIRLAGG